MWQSFLKMSIEEPQMDEEQADNEIENEVQESFSAWTAKCLSIFGFNFRF